MSVGLRHLQFVVVVAKHGSLRRAAKSLNIRQSTLSRAIRQLEIRLGLTLFIRSNTGVRPTLPGCQFLKAATRLVSDFDALVSMAAAMGGGKAGRLTLGLPSSVAMSMLREVLLDYTHECRDVAIHLTAGLKASLLADLRADGLDLVVVVGNVDEENFDSRSLWSERVIVAVPQTHLLAARTFVYWADLMNEVFLTSQCGLGCELKEMLSAKLAAVGGSPRVEEHAIGSEALLSLVAAGRGLTLQCEGAVRTVLPGLVHLEVHDRTGTSWITYTACWKKRITNPALPPLLALLRAHRSLLVPARAPDT